MNRLTGKALLLARPVPVNVQGLRKPGDWEWVTPFFLPVRVGQTAGAWVFDTIVFLGEYFSCYGSFSIDCPYLVPDNLYK